MYFMIISLLNFLFISVLMMMNVAFFTLLERKILSYSQNRVGPNKLTLIGLTQPFSDAIKLLTKPTKNFLSFNYLVYFLTPMLSFVYMLLYWLFFPLTHFSFLFEYSIVLFLLFMSLSVYFIIFKGWSSNSKYSIIGSIRSMAQTISYEISLTLLILSMIFLFFSLDLSHNFNLSFLECFIMLPLFLVLFVCFVAESNRSPFDFAEGESELVSGFNIEYGSVFFTFIFLAEYGIIIVLCIILLAIFTMCTHFMLYVMLALMLNVVFIWLRASFPRYRYDLLMFLNWKSYLPFSFIYMSFVFYLL